MDERKTVWKRKVNSAFEEREKNMKTMKISTSVTLHYISAAMLSDVLKKNYFYLLPSISVLLHNAQCKHTCQFGFFSVRVSSLRMLYILSVYCIHWNNSSLNSHYHCNELVRTMNSRGKINILNKKWKWNATMHNESFFSLSLFSFVQHFESHRLTLNYFILL